MTIRPEDIEAKAKEIIGVVDDTRDTVQDKAMLGVAVVVGVVLLAFLIGRRRGRGSKGKTMVEVYRV